MCCGYVGRFVRVEIEIVEPAYARAEVFDPFEAVVPCASESGGRGGRDLVDVLFSIDQGTQASTGGKWLTDWNAQVVECGWHDVQERNGVGSWKVSTRTRNPIDEWNANLIFIDASAMFEMAVVEK